MKRIEYYKTLDGRCPYKEWLAGLNLEYRVRIMKRVNRIYDGNFGDCKRLRNSELSEMRFFFGKGYRIYYKELDEIIVLFIAGGDKSDQTDMIERANKYYEDYIRRKNNG